MTVKLQRIRPYFSYSVLCYKTITNTTVICNITKSFLSVEWLTCIDTLGLMSTSPAFVIGHCEARAAGQGRRTLVLTCTPLPASATSLSKGRQPCNDTPSQ